MDKHLTDIVGSEVAEVEDEQESFDWDDDSYDSEQGDQSEDDAQRPADEVESAVDIAALAQAGRGHVVRFYENAQAIMYVS